MKTPRMFLRALILACGFLAGSVFAEIDTAPVNVNTADAETLAMALNGVGSKRAEAIVQWRQQYGPFTSVEQLQEVRGVGGEIINRNRDRIAID